MPIDEFQARYPAAVIEGPSSSQLPLATYEMAEEVNIDLVVGSKFVRMNSVGWDGFKPSLIVSDGVIDGAAIAPMNKYSSLTEALQIANELARDLSAAGMTTRTLLSVNRKARNVSAPPVSTLDQAETILRDEQLIIAEMGLFSGSNGEIDMAIVISSPSRIRALAVGAHQSVLADEWRVTIELLRTR